MLSFIRQQDMLEAGESVLLGVSGGADSVCLLAVLCALSEELGITLLVAHVNHGIRKEAGRDCAYVKQLCEARGLPFFERTVDMNALAGEWKCSSEEAGRKARYDFFTELSKEHGIGKIAVAHNMSDCSETVLFHLFRGSGLAGLTGIRPMREMLVRPILCLEREEIENYLWTKGLAYCHDITNDSDDYTRNRIRHHILPYAEEEIVSGATKNVYEAAKHLARVQNFVEQQTCMAWQEVVLCRAEDRIELHIPKLCALHVVLQTEILRKAVAGIAKGCKDITREHIESLLGLIVNSGNRQLYLPYGLRGERSYDRLLIYIVRDCAEEMPDTVIDKELLENGLVHIAAGDALFGFSVLEYQGNPQDIPQNQYTKWFDYDKIKDNLKIRHREKGDYFSVKSANGMGRKRLKDYLIDEKVPRQRRDELLLIAEGSHVLWLLSGRISEYYKVSSETQRVLQISVKEHNGGNDGETQN